MEDTEPMKDQITEKDIDIVVLKCLKEAYFRRVKAENKQKSTMLTLEIDIIESVIHFLSESIKDEKH